MHNQSKFPTPLLLLFALTILILSAPHALAQTGASPAEQTLLQLANQARAQHNLPPLRWDSSLARAAHAHLRWVIRNPGELLHQYPGEPDLVTRGANAGARFGTISENIAGHGDTPASLQQIWMTTPTHRANLLDPNLNVVGIAVVEDQGLLFAVEDFARNVPALTPDAVEHQVAKLLQAHGLAPAASNEDARKTCTMPQGQAGSPKLVIQWDGSDISQLPDVLVQQLDKTKYTSAAVGACPGRQPNQQFTTYHIAVLLY
jgi:Cysteine-rich secretory protein family